MADITETAPDLAEMIPDAEAPLNGAETVGGVEDIGAFVEALVADANGRKEAATGFGSVYETALVPAADNLGLTEISNDLTAEMDQVDAEIDELTQGFQAFLGGFSAPADAGTLIDMQPDGSYTVEGMTQEQVDYVAGLESANVAESQEVQKPPELPPEVEVEVNNELDSMFGDVSPETKGLLVDAGLHELAMPFNQDELSMRAVWIESIKAEMSKDGEEASLEKFQQNEDGNEAMRLLLRVGVKAATEVAASVAEYVENQDIDDDFKWMLGKLGMSKNIRAAGDYAERTLAGEDNPDLAKDIENFVAQNFLSNE